MDLLAKIFAPRQIKALKAMIASILAALEMLGVAIFDTAQTPRGQQLNLSGYQIVFEDNFDGTALDMNKWEYRGNGARSGGFKSPGQVFLNNGNLVIRAEYKDAGDYGAGWYAGMIRTVKDYTRGYFECRCIASKGGGFWSAFWLNSPGMTAEASNGGTGGAEIDIFEAFNYTTTKNYNSVSLNVHIGGYGPSLQSENLGNYKVKNSYTEYSTFGLEGN